MATSTEPTAPTWSPNPSWRGVRYPEWRCEDDVMELGPHPRPVCEGFRWIGQSFRYCDRCGNPYWEHTHNEQLERTGDPFSGGFVLVPITDERRASARAKWGSDDVG